MRSVTAALLLFILTTATAAAQQATWLDSATPAVWNRPGAVLPAAPRDAPTAGLDYCRARERAASGSEETAVTAAGWKLQEFWATQRAGDVALVIATGGYDGMCRPYAFNGFVFVGGRFAGTLAPAPMVSRLDGALSGTPTLRPDGLDASFIRYAPSDPLCCPSRGHTDVTYRVDAGTLVATRIQQRAPTPTQLPRTGGLDLAAGLAGAALALCGWRLRRR